MGEEHEREVPGPTSTMMHFLIGVDLSMWRNSSAGKYDLAVANHRMSLRSCTP